MPLSSPVGSLHVARAGARPSSIYCRALGPIPRVQLLLRPIVFLFFSACLSCKKSAVRRTVVGCMSSGTGTFLMSSLVKMLLKLWFSRSASALSSVTSLPSPSFSLLVGQWIVCSLVSVSHTQKKMAACFLHFLTQVFSCFPFGIAYQVSHFFSASRYLSVG